MYFIEGIASALNVAVGPCEAFAWFNQRGGASCNASPRVGSSGARQCSSASPVSLHGSMLIQ